MTEAAQGSTPSPGATPRGMARRLARAVALALVFVGFTMVGHVIDAVWNGMESLRDFNFSDLLGADRTFCAMAGALGALTGLLDRGEPRFVPGDPPRVLARAAIGAVVFGAVPFGRSVPLLRMLHRPIGFFAMKAAMWCIFYGMPVLLVAAVEARLPRRKSVVREIVIGLGATLAALVALEAGALQSAYATSVFSVSRETMLARLGEHGLAIEDWLLPLAVAFGITLVLRRRGSSLARQAVVALVAAAAATPLSIVTPFLAHRGWPSISNAAIDGCAVPFVLEVGLLFFKPDPPEPVDSPEPAAPDLAAS